MSIARYYNPRLRARLVAGELPGWLVRHPRRRYITAAVLATPPWVDRPAMDALRAEARRLTIERGVRYVLDHEIPLTHPYVCGLHTPENLRVVPYAVNAAKGNKWSPDQMELW